MTSTPPTVSEDSVSSEVSEADRTLTLRYDDWLTAIVANDADRIAEFVTDEWVFVGETGITEGTRFLELVRAGTLTHSAMARVGEPRIRRHGEVAVFSVRVRNTARFDGREFDSDEWTTDVFVERDGDWYCVLTQLTTVRPGE
ncbi:nuclear transport factor 2 family protein [Nocardia aurea]|uniref:nuclear transport factor 2 family protein n=1 Tax=Nocardia aurea TaxID=2144174 RepID=UPI0033BF6BFB